MKAFVAGALALALVAANASAQDTVGVDLVVNDALVKDHLLADVCVTARSAQAAGIAPVGTTDAAGRVTLRLAPGEWRLTYERAGFITLRDTPLVVRASGQVVTTSLVPLAESEGPGGGPLGPQRIALVLNWGSDRESAVRDADSHLVFGGAHVFFHGRKATVGKTTLELDVDDVDWGGPETITVDDAAPGRYEYWVHDYSDGPGHLGTSEVVVRLLVGDAMNGEWRAPASAVGRGWRPFQALVVGADGAVEVVELSAADLAAGKDRDTPDPTTGRDEGAPPLEGGEDVVGALLQAITCCACPGMIVLGLAALFVRSLRLRPGAAPPGPSP